MVSSYLGNLEAKVPFSGLKIYFKWLSCFDTSSWLSSNVPFTMTTNLLYEKACVLFNIAAFLTQAADAYDDTATANHQLLTPHAMAVRTLSRRIPRVKKGSRRCAGASRGRPASSPISRLPHPTPYPPTSGFGYF